LDEEHVDKMLL